MNEPIATRPFAAFEWMLSLRYLRARRKEGFISVIAGFSFLGILLGVATLIIVMAVMNGFRKELLDKILGLNGHLLVQPLDSPLTDWEQVASRIAGVAGVRLAAPIVEGQALASSPFNASGVLVRGIRAADLMQLPSIANNIRQGTIDGFDAGQGLVIGKRLADQLSAHVGDSLTLVAPRGAVTAMGTTPRIKTYKIAAVFEIGMSEYDAAFVFMPMPEAQAYFNRASDVTAIEVYSNDPDDIDALRGRISEAAGRPIFMIDWRQRNATFFNALQVERNVMFLILMLIVLVAALNIVSGLIMLVKDKSGDIAILRTMGATQGAVMRVFLITGASIGVIGTFTGFIVGTLVCLNVESIRQFLSWLTSTELFSPELYFLSRLPAVMDAGEPLAVLLMALVLSLLATLYPSWRAARLEAVERRYRQGESILEILSGAELAVRPGQSVALIGPSGAGKSTLLHIAGLLEHPDAGEVYVDGIPTSSLSDGARTKIRRTEIGFVYQFHHLLPEFSALENVMLPQMIRGLSRQEARRRSAELLTYLGLKERLQHRPAELSGGEQQRVAIARAVANAPRVLLADEPTGNLDPRTSEHVFGTLGQLVRASRLAAIIATHNMDLAQRMDRRVTIREGLLVELS